MKKKNLQRKQRFLAVVLSVMLFAGLLPGSLSQVLAASNEYEDCCTVEVAGDEPDGIYESETLKADQSLAFSEETVKLEYGATAYGQVANAVENRDAADGKGYGTGAVTYRLTDNVLGAQINEKSGTLTFSDGKTGSVTVTAKKEADECYNECEASYTLVITYMQAPDVTYRLQGPQNSVNEDGTALPFSYHGDSTAAWFTDTVTIQAPDGYLISRTNSLSSRNWSASISCTEEGHNEISYYLRNRKSGGITDVLTIYDLKIDKGNPTDLQMEYLIEEAPAAWKDSVLYGKDEIAVRLTAKDTMSGLKGLYYQYKSNVISTSSQGKDWTKVDLISDKIEKVDNEDGSISYVFRIPAQFRGNVSFKAVDQANRVTEYWDDRTVVADNRNPQAIISYTAHGGSCLVAKVTKDTEESQERADVPEDQVDENTRFIYDGAVTASVDMTEANFEAEDVVLTVWKDGTEIWNGAVAEAQKIANDCEISEWTVNKENDKESLAIQLLTDGDYQIGISYKDRSDNKMHYVSGEYEQKEGEAVYQSNIITIDTTNPEVEVSYDNNTVVNQHYYNAGRVATIKVTDRNFRPSETDWKITAKDGDAVIDPKTVENGNANVVDDTYSELKNWSDWTQDPQDPSVWYAKIPFEEDAFYNVSFACRDLAGHALKEDYADAFVVDTTKAPLEKMKISYSEELHTWQKVVQAITFGYFSYKDQVTVTLTSEDEMSGIDYITWTYKRENGASTTKNVSEPTDWNAMTHEKEG